jgi:oxygen-independent coproporphyrinogen-3 oxidase
MPQSAAFDAELAAYVTSLVRQVSAFGRTNRYRRQPCGAVYFGGGTASILSEEHLSRLIEALAISFTLDESSEITLEGNPHDFTLNYLLAVRNLGVTRISMGLQSFLDPVLRALNSPHNAEESESALTNALDAGFYTVNVDLLYRVPGQSFEQWRADVARALAIRPQGITTYRYIVHAASASEHLIDIGRLPAQASIDEAHKWYCWSRKVLTANGYVERRKGGFSLPGHIQRYGELTYGRRGELIGIGANSYGYANSYQWLSPSTPEEYVALDQAGRFPIVAKISRRATERLLMERFVIFGFMRSAIDRREFYEEFGEEICDRFAGRLSHLESAGFIRITERAVELTDLGEAHRERVQDAFFAPDDLESHQC